MNMWQAFTAFFDIAFLTYETGITKTYLSELSELFAICEIDVGVRSHAVNSSIVLLCKHWSLINGFDLPSLTGSRNASLFARFTFSDLRSQLGILCAYIYTSVYFSASHIYRRKTQRSFHDYSRLQLGALCYAFSLELRDSVDVVWDSVWSVLIKHQQAV